MHRNRSSLSTILLLSSTDAVRISASSNSVSCLSLAPLLRSAAPACRSAACPPNLSSSPSESCNIRNLVNPAVLLKKLLHTISRSAGKAPPNTVVLNSSTMLLTKRSLLRRKAIADIGVFGGQSAEDSSQIARQGVLAGPSRGARVQVAAACRGFCFLAVLKPSSSIWHVTPRPPLGVRGVAKHSAARRASLSKSSSSRAAYLRSRSERRALPCRFVSSPIAPVKSKEIFFLVGV